MAKDAKGHGSDGRGNGMQAGRPGWQAWVGMSPAAHQSGVEATTTRGAGVDGFGMTPEEAGAHVAAGRMSSPPLGVYADKATHDRYRAAASLPPKKF